MNNTKCHFNETLADNAGKSENPEPMDLIVKRCQRLHDEAIFAFFADIFKPLERLFEQKEMGHHVHVK